MGGSFLFAFGVNVLITPLGLYNGGFMGIAQLLRTFIVQGLHVPGAGGGGSFGLYLLYYEHTAFLHGLPGSGAGLCRKDADHGRHTECVPHHCPPYLPPRLWDDYLTSCIIGGIVAGTGDRACASGQELRRRAGYHRPVLYEEVSRLQRGQDQYPDEHLCVRHLSFMFNIEIVIYSLIYTTILSVAIDHVHIQNINMSVMIFTKKTGISRAIMEQLGRGRHQLGRGGGLHQQDLLHPVRHDLQV